MEEKLRCNICNEVIDLAEVGQHVTSRNHAVKKKVAEFHEMNAQLGNGRKNITTTTTMFASAPNNTPISNDTDGDTSVVAVWLRGLHVRDYLSLGSHGANTTTTASASANI